MQDSHLKPMGKALFSLLLTGPQPRKVLVTKMAESNGNVVTKENYSSDFRGYGSVMLQHHYKRGRITSSNGVYSITDIGRTYVGL